MPVKALFDVKRSMGILRIAVNVHILYIQHVISNKK
jgi:hypothetical protein